LGKSNYLLDSACLICRFKSLKNFQVDYFSHNAILSPSRHCSSKPAVVDAYYPATQQQQPIYTANGVSGNNVYSTVPSAYNGLQQQQQPTAAPSTIATGVPLPAPPGRPGVHAAVLRALTDPNEAYFQIIDQLDRKLADVNALDSNGSGQTALHVAAAAGLDSLVELLLEKGAQADAIDAAGDTPLHLAAKNGKLDAVKSLLRYREGAAGINGTNNEGLTPLVQAVFESLNVDVVHELLHNGADPNVSILDDGTVLHLMTATPGFENIVREAVRCGGDLEARDNNGNTPLHTAAHHGKTSLLEFFLNQKPELAHAQNILGQTPYQVAVENNHAESAKLLAEWSLRDAAFTGDADCLLSAISSGAARLSSPIDCASNTAVHLLAEKNHSTQLESLLSEATRPEIDAVLICTNAQGNTPLHVAAQHGSAEVVLSFAGQQSTSLQEAMSLANVDGLTPLLLAAKEGHVQVAHELLNEVPSGVMQGDEAGNQALHFAAQEGHLPMVELLLARGADVNALNNFHQTPLHLAATWNEALVVHRLLECGADPVAVDDQGKTPLELARRQDHVELWHAMLGSQLRRAAGNGDLLAVMSVLTSGALVDSKNNTSGDTALHVASKNGHVPVLGTLLEYSADPAGSVGVLNDAGDAPLHVAARAGEVEIIRVLLSVPGVDPNMTTAEGDTALHIAAGEMWIQAVQELFKGDAELDKCSEGRGSTALMDAACNCDLAMVKTLLQLGADPNAVDSFSCNNALHQVALWGQTDGSAAIVAALIEAGANPEAKNSDGKTPADLARTATAANNSLSTVVESGVVNIIELEEQEVTAPPAPPAPSPPFSPPSAMMSFVPPPTSTATIASSSNWGATSMMPAATAPMATTVTIPAAMVAAPEPAAAATAAGTGVLGASPVGCPDGPVRVPSEVYYPNIFATNDDPSSMPPSPPRLVAPASAAASQPALCVPIKSVRAAAVGPAPSSPFAAALPPPPVPPVPPPPAVNPASLNPLSAPPRSRTTSSQDENGNNINQGVVEERRVSSSEPSGATNGSASSTTVLDNRLLIPYNQLKYDSRAPLGQGSFGKVFRGILHGNRVAIKILFHQDEEYSILPARAPPPPPAGLGAAGAVGPMIPPVSIATPTSPKTVLSQRMMEDFVREIDVMAGLRHDNIQDLRGYCITPDGPAIVSKYYARGSMADSLRQGLSNPERRAELTWTRRLHMAVDVAAGLLYMHSYETPILHRDLKAINCFLDEHYRALVGDFGLTKPMQDRARSAASSGAVANNPRWLAPELLTDTELGESHYTTKTDVYAFGMVMFELLTWREPFRNTGHWEIINKVGKGERPVIPPRLPGVANDNEIFIQGGVMEEYVQLMNRCWAQDPAARPEFEEIHPQLEKMLVQHIQNVRAIRERENGGGVGGNRAAGLVNGGISSTGEPVRMALPQ
jgi:ankyrin repeat protein/serine/threonine protein kinase